MPAGGASHRSSAECVSNFAFLLFFLALNLAYVSKRLQHESFEAESEREGWIRGASAGISGAASIGMLTLLVGVAAVELRKLCARHRTAGGDGARVGKEGADVEEGAGSGCGRPWRYVSELPVE